MKIYYGMENDILIITFSDKPIAFNEVSGDGMDLLRYAEDGTPVRLEIVSPAARGINPQNIDISIDPLDSARAHQNADRNRENIIITKP